MPGRSLSLRRSPSKQGPKSPLKLHSISQEGVGSLVISSFLVMGGAEQSDDRDLGWFAKWRLSGGCGTGA